MLKATDPAAGEAVTPADDKVVDPAKGQPTDAPQNDFDDPAHKPADEKAEPDKPDAEKKGAEDGEKASRNRVRFHQRIQQLTQRNNALHEQAEYQRERAERAEAQLRPPKNLEELSYDEREALRLQQVLDRRDAREATAEAERLEGEARSVRNAVFHAKLEGIAERAPDFLQKFSQIDISEDVADAIAESEKAPELAYFLANNPDIAGRLYQATHPRTATPQSWRAAMRWLAHQETRLQAAPAVRKATKAPDPGTVLNGGSPPAAGRSIHELAEDENSIGEYIKQRQKDWKEGRA